MTILRKHRRECVGEEKVGILWAKRGRKEGSDHSHRGLHCSAYTNAEKKPTVTGTQGSRVRNEGYRAGVRSSRFLETTCTALYSVKI